MRSEWIKIRSMPTPLWCLVAVIIGFVLGLVGTVIWGHGEDAAAIDLALGFPTAIASIVLGVWIVGVEFGQNTLRRTLTADPRRLRLIGAKLLVAALVVAAVTILIHLVAWPVYSLAGSGHEGSLSAETIFKFGLAALLTNLTYMLIGAACALISASMAGGMTLALIFIFVIDSIFPLIPKAGDFAFGLALVDVTDAIRGFDSGLFSSDEGHSVGIAALIAAAWLVILLALGSLRFNRSDVK